MLETTTAESERPAGDSPLAAFGETRLKNPAAAKKLALVVLVVPCLASCFLMVPIISSVKGPPQAPVVPFGLAAVGCILAQGTLLAAWLAWGDQPFLRRLGTHWTIAAGLCALWLLGVFLAVPSFHNFSQVASSVAPTVPLISLGAQMPLWIARQQFGWRLVLTHGPLAEEPPLTIRDLMLATVIVAVTLTVARLAVGIETGERRIMWGMVFTVACVATSLAVLPAAPLLLWTRDFRRGILFFGLYVAFGIGLQWTVIAVARYYGPVPPLAICLGLSSLVLAFGATLVVAANAARAHGYRLHNGRRGVKT